MRALIPGQVLVATFDKLGGIELPRVLLIYLGAAAPGEPESVFLHLPGDGWHVTSLSTVHSEIDGRWAECVCYQTPRGAYSGYCGLAEQVGAGSGYVLLDGDRWVAYPDLATMVAEHGGPEEVPEQPSRAMLLELGVDQGFHRWEVVTGDDGAVEVCRRCGVTRAVEVEVGAG
jgi:hypothetical protein